MPERLQRCSQMLRRCHDVRTSLTVPSSSTLCPRGVRALPRRARRHACEPSQGLSAQPLARGDRPGLAPPPHNRGTAAATEVGCVNSIGPQQHVEPAEHTRVCTPGPTQRWAEPLTMCQPTDGPLMRTPAATAPLRAGPREGRLQGVPLARAPLTVPRHPQVPAAPPPWRASITAGGVSGGFWQPGRRGCDSRPASRRTPWSKCAQRASAGSMCRSRRW
jgi:hypothetical protein